MKFFMTRNNNVANIADGLIKSLFIGFSAFPSVNTTNFLENDSAQFDGSSVDEELFYNLSMLASNVGLNLTKIAFDFISANSTTLLASLYNTTVNEPSSSNASAATVSPSTNELKKSLNDMVNEYYRNLFSFETNPTTTDAMGHTNEKEVVQNTLLLTTCSAFAIASVGASLMLICRAVKKCYNNYCNSKKSKTNALEKVAVYFDGSENHGNIALVEKRQSLQECSTQSDDNIPVNSKENSSKKSLDISDRDQWKFNRQPSTDLESASSESIETKLGLSEV